MVSRCGLVVVNQDKNNIYTSQIAFDCDMMAEIRGKNNIYIYIYLCIYFIEFLVAIWWLRTCDN